LNLFSAVAPNAEEMKANPESSSEIVLYQTADGRTRIECRFEQENGLDDPGR